MYLCVHFSAYFLAYIAIFILLFKVVLPSHLRHCMFVFSHTSQYDFTHISQHILRVCIRVSHMYVYVVFFSLHLTLFTHISYIFILTSHSFCQNLFCNTCIAYVYVPHTFGFDFLFSKADASHTFVLYFLKILEYK